MQADFNRWAHTASPDRDGLLEFGAASLRDSIELSRLAVDPVLTAFVRSYWGKPVVLAQSIGMRLEPAAGLPDYGAFQWHHDAKHKQVKVMVLLTDVPDDGQRMDYLPGTNRDWRSPKGYAASRFSDQMVRRYGEPVRCSGPAGTVVIFDTNGLHRGNRNAGPRRDVWVHHYTAGRSLFPLSGLHPEVERDLTADQRRLVRLSEVSSSTRVTIEQ